MMDVYPPGVSLFFVSFWFCRCTYCFFSFQAGLETLPGTELPPSPPKELLTFDILALSGIIFYDDRRFGLRRRDEASIGCLSLPP